MADIIPINGIFENAKAFLYDIANDDTISEFAMVIIHKDGNIGRANFKMTRANMAYASIIFAEWCREPMDSF